jgi:hypothetical protein
VTRLRRFDLNWILALLLAIPAVAPLTYPGFFQAQSGFLPAYNAAHLDQAPNWGGTTEPLRGEGKLPYLLAWPFFARSGSGIVAVRWGYALAFLLSALGIYAWVHHWLGARGAILAATVYTYLPWHLSAVYVRGAYAEAWLWAFLPFLPWAIDRLLERPRRVSAAAAVGLPALAAGAWTQPGLGALFLPVLAAYGIVVSPHRRRLGVRLLLVVVPLLILLWGIGRTVPAGRVAFADHFLAPYQLLSAAWGWGSSVAGWADGMTFELGLAAAGLAIVALTFNTGTRRISPDRHTALRWAIWFWAIVLAVLVLFTLSLSAFLWRAGRLEAFVTYPWQVLALTGLPLAFLAGSAIRLERQLAELPVWTAILALVLLASYPYLAPRFTQVTAGSEPVARFQPVDADAPQILLLDDQISPPTGITSTLKLTLTWQAIAPVAGDYTVFAHLLAAGDTKVAQVDTRPCGGECPTDTWQPGEIVEDRYQLALAPDAPPGPYRLAVGLYLLDTGERAAIAGRDDNTVYLNVP